MADFQFSATERTGGHDQSITVWVITQPEWTFWKYHRRYYAGSAGMCDMIVAYDGQFLRQLQTDGMGRLSSQAGPPSYMSVVGMYLSNWGPAPRDTKGRRLSWLEYLFNDPELTVTDDPNQPGVVTAENSSVKVVLDASKAFAPVHVVWYGPDRGILSETRLDEYQNIGGVWVPHRLDDVMSSYRLNVNHVSVNQGLSAEDMRVAFPLGTSVLLDNNAVRVYGDAQGVEEEEALQSWIMYEDEFGRKRPQTAPRVATEIVDEAESTSIAIIIINTAIAAIAFGAGILRARGRRFRGAAIVAAFGLCYWSMPRSLAQLISTDAPDRSVAYSVYIALDSYGRELPLGDIVAETNQHQRGLELGVASVVLQNHGVHTRPVSWTLEKLAAWPYPVLMLLQRVNDPAKQRCGVLLASEADRFTMFDPGQFGRLEPWSPEFLKERWTGEALLTSPVPIRSRDPYVLWRNASFVLPLVGVGVFLSLGRRGALVRTGTAVSLVITLSGCTGGEQRTNTRAGVKLESADWLLGEVYPDVFSRKFTLRNESSQRISLREVKKSCGCIASGIPESLELASGEVYEFQARISLENARGAVRQSIQMSFSEGDPLTIKIEGIVRSGLAAQPDRLVLESNVPNQMIHAEVKIVCDDGQPFKIKSASCARSACEVVVGSDTISVSVVNQNRETSYQDVLTIVTDHPRARELRVPILAKFDLTWEIRPSVVSVRLSDAGDFVERTVRVVSKQNAPFVIDRVQMADWAVLPLNPVPAASHDVRIRVRNPTLTAATPRRVEIRIPTSLADAPEVVLPFVFY